MHLIFVLLDFKWHDLINPQFYIEFGGLWLLLFVIFAETGLFAGFFLPGDSLLFVAGIYSDDLAGQRHALERTRDHTHECGACRIVKVTTCPLRP